MVAYAMVSPGPPFPVMCVAYAFNGFGIALQDAQANGYVACLKENASEKMGLLHAVYGWCIPPFHAHWFLTEPFLDVA